MRQLFSILITTVFFLDGDGQDSQKVDSLNKMGLCLLFIYLKLFIKDPGTPT